MTTATGGIGAGGGCAAAVARALTRDPADATRPGARLPPGPTRHPPLTGQV